MPTSNEKAETYHHGDLRAALVDAGISLLRSGGADAVTLRAVAREAGVSHAAPYRHFSNRDQLFAEVATPCLEDLGRRLEDAAGTADGDAGVRIRNLGRAYLAFAIERPEEYRLIFGSRVAAFDAHEGLSRASKAAFGVLVTAIEAGQAKGRIVAGPAAGLATFAWATLHGLAGLFVDHRLDAGDEAMRSHLVSRVTDLIIDGMGVR